MYQSEHSKIEHEKDGDILVIHLRDSIRDENTLRSELLHLASHVQHGGIRKVMIKNEELAHPVSAEFQQWAKASIELPLLAGGVDKIAIVHPKDKRMFSLIHTGDSVRKRYFSSESEARNWLG